MWEASAVGRIGAFLCLVLAGMLGAGGAVAESAAAGKDAGIFARENLAAWCIVPFDAKKRGPEARAEMLGRLGFKKFAYDWRAEHIPTFDEELQTLARWGIALSAFWFPAGLNDEARAILAALERNGVKTDLWVSMHGGEIECSAEEQAARVQQHVEALRPIVAAAAAIGCRVGLYNHGGWFGEPENQIAILRALEAPNAGIVYNQHHGHAHIDRFPALLEMMKPYLYCLNLNGMVREGDQKGQKILPLGSGDLDLEMLRAVLASGYAGPIGILGHTDDDAEDTLRNNLDGLDWLLPQLDGTPPAGPRPALHTGAGAAAAATMEVEDAARRAALPEFQVIAAALPGERSAARAVPGEHYQRWWRSHGNNSNSRFATGGEITRASVGRLAKAWEYRSGDGAGNVQCNPIVVGEVIYAPTSGGHVVALDARTGRERWRFLPGGTPAHRGLLYWPGDGTSGSRLFFSAERFLWCLDPEDGVPVAGFGAGGKVAVGESRVAPVVHGGLVILALYARDVVGLDVRSGAEVWRFSMIPSGGEYGADTWSGPGAGANCWGGIALDEGRGIVYCSTGSPKPNFAGNTHHGQNLFANCVIAIDAATGVRRWHFQEIAHDIWDLDIPAPPVLVSVVLEGQAVDAVAQVTKLGNTLLLDRETGKPLFPMRYRRAPASTLPGERTWPYQPDFERPAPFARQVFGLEDVTERSAEARSAVMQRLEQANFGFFAPFEEDKPTALYNIHGGAEWTGAAVDPARGRLYVSSNNVPWLITVFRPDEVARDPGAPPTRGEALYVEHCAKCHGVDRMGVGMNPPLQGLARRSDDARVLELFEKGRNLMPALGETVSAEERRALLDYIFLRDVAGQADGGARDAAGPRYVSNGYPKLLDHEGYPGSKPPWGTLNCVDLNTGQLVWQRSLGYYPDLAAWGEDDTGAENFGGATVTAGGLVFCAGTPDLKIRAFDAENGEEVWSHDLPFGGYAPPTVYEAGGRQYVVIAATGGGKLGTEMGDAYVAFALDGAAGN